MHSLIYSLLIILLLICLLLWNCRKRDNITLSRESCLQNLNDLRGLFALEIVMGHVVRYENTILYPLGKFMICSVAFFYFVSAFGMAVSYEKKKDYLNLRFLLAKPIYIFALAILFFIAGIIADILCPSDLTYIDHGILWGFRITTNWYIWELIGFYLIFFFIYRYIPRFRILLICTITLILSVIMYLNGFWEAYVASTFAFPAGLVCGEYFSNMKEFLYSLRGVCTAAFLGIFGLCCLFMNQESMVTIVFMRNSLCLSAVMIIWYACNYFTLGANPAARFLNKYSAEIYLSQFICIRLAESYGWNYMARMPFVLITTIVLAVLMRPVVIKIRKVLIQC